MDTPVTAGSAAKVDLPILGVLAIAASYSVFFLKATPSFASAARTALFEDITAVCFFAASLIFAVPSGAAAWQCQRQVRGGKRLRHLPHPPKRLVSSCCRCLSSLAAAREISWGQRIFAGRRRRPSRRKNIQRETNIHNLKMFNRNDEHWKGKKAPPNSSAPSVCSRCSGSASAS
jgi:hypothetical protein